MKIYYPTLVIIIFLFSCGERIKEDENKSISESAYQICAEMINPLEQQYLHESKALNSSNSDKKKLEIEKLALNIKMGRIACECSANDAISKKTEENSLKNEIYNFSKTCKYTGIEKSGFVDLHRKNLIKTCYMKGSTAGTILALSYGELWLFKSQEYSLETLRKAYPKRIETCACFENFMSTLSNEQVWEDISLQYGNSITEAKLKSCENQS